MDPTNVVAIKFFIWIGVTLLGALLAHLSFYRIYIKQDPNHTCWNKWLYFKHDYTKDQYYFSIDTDQSSPFKKAYDIIYLINHAAILFYFGNIVNKFHLDQPLDILYAVFCLFWVVFWGLLGQVRGVGHLAITPSVLKNMNLGEKIGLGIVVALLLGLMSYHIYLAAITGIIVYYLLALILIPATYTLAYWFMKLEHPQPKWHIHHWFIGFFFTLMFRFDTVISNLAAMGFYGVCIQGSIAYGVIPIITQSLPI